jgi:hypothetical protein
MTTNGYKEASEALKKESSVQPDPKAKGMLEKKWASIVRMQKKVRRRFTMPPSFSLPAIGLNYRWLVGSVDFFLIFRRMPSVWAVFPFPESCVTFLQPYRLP